MVVTRRTPVPPVAASRTQSSQPIPRVAKKSPDDASNAPEKPSPLANGVTLDTTGKDSGASAEPTPGVADKSTKSKGKHHKKGAKKKSSRSAGFMELLFRALLLWFTIYTLSVCPQDEQLKKPVCRGLAEYRRLVIEPYILPPIQQALSHPSVSPYVEKARPYADYALRTAKPVVTRAQKEFNAHVVPQWNKRVVPLYHKYAVPQLLKLDAQTAPYRNRVEQEYERVLAPYVRRTASAVHYFQHKARPYVALAVEKTYQSYQAARPYAKPVWEKIKVVLAHATAFLGEQRRQFVDPHVQKIWEHVKEMSNGKPTTSAASSMRSSAPSQVSKASTKISSSVASSTISGMTAIPSAANGAPDSPNVAPPAVPSPDVLSAAQGTEDIEPSVSAVSSSSGESAEPILAESPSSDPATASPSFVETDGAPADHSISNTPSASLETAASALAESATTEAADTMHPASSAITSTTDEPTALSVDDVGVPEAEPAAVTVTEADADPEAIPATPTPVPEAEPEEAAFVDPDMALFEELGLMDDFLSDMVPEEVTAEPEVDLEAERAREEARRAREEKTARDRADIERRHTQWEREVEELVAKNKKALRKALVAIRKAAVADFKQNTAIRDEVEGLIEDSEKFLRGAEKYLANLQKESRKLEEKQIVWERVLAKLEDKFQGRLEQTEGIVNGWYQSVVEQELAEVDRLTKEVRDVADRGQADVGLDYAYLDDVTTWDWTRYHDLMKRSDNFTAYAQTVQDGSHPSPPINPIVPVLEELQAEVEDVISGYNARLRKIKRDGARAFGAPDADADDTVSILPVDDAEDADAELDAANVVVGRGKEEVEAALHRAAADDQAAARHAEL